MAGKAKTQQKRWHLDGGIEVTNIQNENGDQRPSTFLGNYNGDNAQSLALVAYTGSYYDLVDYPDLTHYVVDGDYVHTDNNFTDADKAKLAASYNYVLPVATEKILGGVKVGDHLEMRIDPKITDPKARREAVADRISVIESHFIYVQNARNVTRFDEIPTSSAGQMQLAPIYSPTGESITGHYIRYNDMVFFSEDAKTDTEEFNGKTIKIEQEKMTKGGLWWTTKNTGQWVKVLDQFNIISFNDRVGKVYPVGMDDYKLEAEDYTADMVGAIARRGVGGSWTNFKNKAGRTVMSFWNGSSLKGLEDNSAGWARIGNLGWDEEKQVTKPDPINSPTGGVITGVYWKYTGLPTLPAVYETTKTGAKKLVTPPTYRGINNTSMFFMPDGQDRIWVKRSSGEFDDNDWFYLEQLPIATRTRLGGVIVGAGLDITEEGVLSVSGLVTSWTGKQGARRVNDVVAMNGDYDAKMITFGNEWSNTANVDYELKRLQTELNKKAPIYSPVFSGVPTTPTPPYVDSSLKIANTAWVTQYVAKQIQDIVGYTLPPATTSMLGGIIVGDGLRIDSNGRLSVNTSGGGSGSGGSIVVDTSLSSSSTNPVENRAIYNAINTINQNLNKYVLITDGSAKGLQLTDSTNRGTTYITLPAGTNDTRLATTAFVNTAVQNAINTIGSGGSGGGSVVINSYTLPIANATDLGGVKVTNNDGILIVSGGTIKLDEDYITEYLESGGLNYISSMNVIGQQGSQAKTWDDIPINSSGVVTLQAAYSPVATEVTGHYLKYGVSDDSYIFWFCDFDTNDSYYLYHLPPNQYGWSKTFSIKGSQNFEDFDLSLYAKLDSPSFTGDARSVYPGLHDNSDRIATTGFVQTEISYRISEQPKASESQWGIVKIKHNGGIKIDGQGIYFDGVTSFQGRSGAARTGRVTANQGDYRASDITYGSNGAAWVSTALDLLFQNKAPLNGPEFTGVPKIKSGSTSSPIATEYYVRQWKPIASTSDLGMIKVGDGLQISADGTLSTSGAVTGWTGNQGTRQAGEVIATAGDYNSQMIYYDPQDGSKTVRSELDLKAYDDQVWHRADVNKTWATIDDYSAGPVSNGNANGIDTPSYMSAIKLGATTIITNSYKIVPSNDEWKTKVYTSRYRMYQVGAQYTYGWTTPLRLLDTDDLVSPAFTGTPTINGRRIATVSIAGTNLGLVKNGGNVVIDADGEMDYTLPTASSSILGGIKVGNGLSVSSDGTLSTSGAVTTWNSRSGNVLPEAGDYTSVQITYDTTRTVKDKLDEIDSSILSLTNGSGLPIASATQIGAVKIGDGINVDADGVISMSGVTSFNGRGGAVIPQGDEQDYTADMVGAIAKKIDENSSDYILNALGTGKNVDNSSGVVKTRTDMFGTNNEELYAAYFNATGNRRGTFGPLARFLLTIAAFWDVTGSGNAINGQKPGLYYSKGNSTGYYATPKWVKLIDTENISDYIPDTSSFYNTENYTTTEISDEITATLAELNA